MIEVEQNIWVSSTNGVWIVDRKELTANHQNILNQAFSGMYYDRSKNVVCLGTVDGLYLAQPAIICDSQNDSPIIITAIHGNIPEGSEGKSIRYLERISLRHDQNTFTLEFSDFNFSQEKRSSFIYKLNQKDDSWHLLNTNNNAIYFSNLEPGKYSLLISRLGTNGQPSGEVKVFDILINPSWYFSPLAKALYLLLAGGLTLWTFYFFRVRNQLRFERLEKEKTLEQLKLKIDLLTEMPHAFKTSLSHAVTSNRPLPGHLDPSVLYSRVEKLLADKMRVEALVDPNGEPLMSYAEKLLVNVTHIIEANLADSDFNVNILCEKAGVGQKQLYRKIKQLTGMTTIEYIKSIKLKKAAILLASGKFTVSEVMYMVGFNNHSYFAKCFYTQFGVHPNQYRS
jgi:AraC-like DNA-binding protein